MVLVEQLEEGVFERSAPPFEAPNARARLGDDVADCVELCFVDHVDDEARAVAAHQQRPSLERPHHGLDITVDVDEVRIARGLELAEWRVGDDLSATEDDDGVAHSLDFFEQV